MFWADNVKNRAKERFQAKIKNGAPIIIRDEKTASGRVHVGSMRGVAIHAIVAQILSEDKIKNKFLYEINDFDPMDSLPSYLDQEKFLPYMGRALRDVPSPDDTSKNFAEYFGNEFKKVIADTGYKPEFYLSSEMYLSGKFNEVIALALKNADKIRKIYKLISGADKSSDWLPINIVCQNCGKISTTRATKFDGQKIYYECNNPLKWASGCGHKNNVSPLNGNAKLPWKVEWAAKFKVLDVDIEGCGKDHATKGGARQIADAISKEVFDHEPPLNIPYEFFLVGGKKMSSSKGFGSSSREIADLLPPHLLRFLLSYKDPMKTIDFIPDGDTIPILYDTFDKYMDGYFKGNKDDYSRVIELVKGAKDDFITSKHLLSRFSETAYLIQMPHMNVEEQIAKNYSVNLNPNDKKEIALRSSYARKWLSTVAPEDYKFELQEKMPNAAKNFSSEIKMALAETLRYIKGNEKVDGKILHERLHEIRKASGVQPKEFFSAIYISILGKESGPKAGWFLSVLDRNFLLKRLEEVSSKSQ